MKRINTVMVVACALLTVTACRRDMQDQPKYKPLGANGFFPDGRDSRPIPVNTIARDEGNETDPAHTGARNGQFLETIPEPIDETLLRRGRDRFDIYCSPCHGRIGDGNGMIRQRGFWYPSNLHTDRLRAVPPGYLFQVITNGYGGMPDYRDQIAPHDRWAIVAYLRALQLSRHAALTDVPPEVRRKLVSGVPR